MIPSENMTQAKTMRQLINGKHTPRLLITGGVLFFLLFPLRLFAQGENNNWLFDYTLRLSFNTNPPSFWGDTTMPVDISASVSDAGGNLLFSASYNIVYDRNHNAMPNGAGIPSYNPVNVGYLYNVDKKVVIVPHPGNNKQYFIIGFKKIYGSPLLFGQANNVAICTLVDMSLNNGLGDVVQGMKAVPLADSLAANVNVATQGSPCGGYWLLFHKSKGAAYLAFPLTPSGISVNPIVSFGLSGINETFVHRVCFNNRTGRVVNCISNSNAADMQSAIETGLFNKFTGQFTDFYNIDTGHFSTNIKQEYFAPILSPDGTKLYCVSNRVVYPFPSSGIVPIHPSNTFEQFDLSLMPNILAVKNSRYVLDSAQGNQYSRTGPDNKIYHIRAVDTSALTVINNPNATGAVCGYTPAVIPAPALALFPFQYYFLSHFGSNVLFNRPADTVFNSITIDTNVCPIDTITLAADTGYQSTLWSTGSVVGTETFTQSGTYWVSGIKNCTLYIDTIKLQFTLDTIAHAATDTTLCFGSTMVLQPESIYQAYSWSNGGTGSSITVNQPGLYTLTGTSGCNAFTDTFKLHLPVDTIYTNAIQDTIICDDKAVTLQADTSHFSVFWSTGNSNTAETFSTPGNYWLITNKGCATSVDSFYIDALDIDLGNDTVLCDGDTLTLHMNAGSNAQYLWQDGSTLPVYSVTGGGSYAVSVKKNSCVVRDTINVDLIIPSLSILENDTIICKGEQIILHVAASPESNFLWNTGTGGLSTETNGVGVYTVAATNICGTFHDSVRVKEKDCPCIVFVPNAFSPNGDGRNEMFDVNVRCPFLNGYLLMVYNRYGQKIFESLRPEKGWNGWYNGNPADPGTYFYYLKYKDGQKETRKKGDLILIR
jgi:gliding motility-associated-like protein